MDSPLKPFQSTFSLVLALVSVHSAFAVDVLTQHNDNLRTGANTSEIQLNVQNVNPAHFGKIDSIPVDGDLFAQPLYVSKVLFPGGVSHNLLILATMHDTIYAFDADQRQNHTPIWSKSLGTAMPRGDIPIRIYNNLDKEVGILSTPVIDRATNTVYAVAENCDPTIRDLSQAIRYRLFALDLLTGANKPGSPATIEASLPGRGDNSQSGEMIFNTVHQNQRPALLLDHGIIYIAFAGWADQRPYHGWLLAYDAQKLTQVGAWVDTPNGGGGGIWQSGQGPSADENGNIYVTSGNGYNSDATSATDHPESVIKLKLDSNGFTTLDWFTPPEWKGWDKGDLDFGSSGVLLIPGTNQLVSGSKAGNLYIEDRDHLGHIWNSQGPGAQVIKVSDHHVHGSPIFWKSDVGDFVYVWTEQDHLKAFRFENGVLKSTPDSQSPTGAPLHNSMPGGIVSLSANQGDKTSGIIWGSVPLVGTAETQTTTGIIHAYDATNLNHELWNSEMNKARDAMGNLAKYVPPTIADGKVFVATFSGQVVVYGLLGN